MQYKLICLDIDGTLLNDQKKLLPEVKESLQKAADNNIIIALVSGRMPAGVELIEKDLGLPCIKVCNAGTYIIMNDTCISKEYLSTKTLKSIYTNIATKYNIPLWIFRDKNWYVTGVDQYIEKERVDIQHEPLIIDADHLIETWEKDGLNPNKLLLAAKPEKIRAIAQEIDNYQFDDVDLSFSADVFLEIFPKGVTKGTALKHICEKLSIKKEETIAFGDHELDIPLIETAGTGIAMGNAVEALKAKADFITKTNNEAGVAFALNKFVNLL